jgi:hypothetical protein
MGLSDQFDGRREAEELRQNTWSTNNKHSENRPQNDYCTCATVLHERRTEVDTYMLRVKCDEDG